jgi:uncharacterized protein YjlB
MKKEYINTDPQIEHFILEQNGNFPNNTLPVLIYKNAIVLTQQKKQTANIAQQIFEKNDWGNTWENGIYNFHHYHSNTHESLAIAEGSAQVILGGPDGKKVEIKAGDIIIIPAGVGHKCLSASEDFSCVGGYPEGKDYDIKGGKESELPSALKHIHEVPLPATDPVYGNEKLILSYWK